MALHRQISPTGLTQWSLPNSEPVHAMSLIWPGPGSGLNLGINANVPGGSMSRIEHPSASGTYDTRKDAEAAVQRFIAALDQEENRD